jgi:TolB-like protein/DNA-binding winged helix-turn-helix (wHTH) protein/Tfp pilus assembly protein PilF
MSGPESHIVYEFGDFRLDSGRRLLFAKGEAEPRAIPPKAFETLLYFVEHHGELLDKDRLIAELWPGLVVEENSLTQVISLLRRVLGEARGENRYFATVPGRGYRFVAHVTRLPDVPAVRLGVGRRRRIKPSALVALTVCAFGAALFAYGRYAGWWPAREAGELPTAKPSVTLTELPPRTVAILPFANLSADADDEFVAFGVAESVLHRLASIQDLTLIARTSSFAFRDKPANARDIGRTLNARYLVEGSVHRAGDRLRITAQLIDATTGVHVWSLRFDRTIDDIFAVEDEISQSVARALEVSLGGEQHPFARYGIDAYLAYLEGRALIASRKTVDAERAIERFWRAIEIAPTFAAAYAALAGAHIHLALMYGEPDSSDFAVSAYREAEPLLARALQLDDALGEAYVLRADLKDYKGDKSGAEADFRKGLALSPNDGAGHELFAEFLDREGRIDEALAAVDRARVIDPLYPRSHYYKGLLLLLHGRGSLEEAEALFLQALRIAPTFHPALMRLASIRGFTGRLAEAVNYSERAVTIDPRSIWMRVELSMLYLDLHDPDAARNVIAELADPPPETWVPICLYENDLEGAHRILRGVGLKDIALDQLHIPVLLAVRDRALANGDHAGARELMQAVAEKWDPIVSAAVAGLAVQSPGDLPLAGMDLVAAQWQKSIGEQRRAEASARAVMEWLDLVEGQAPPGRLAPWFDRTRAVALAMLGRNEAALAALERAFAAGNIYGWWYDVDREPAFAALREDPRFKTLAAHARAHANAQRKLLEQMRRDGTVPLRTMSASMARAC